MINAISNVIVIVSSIIAIVLTKKTNKMLKEIKTKDDKKYTRMMERIKVERLKRNCGNCKYKSKSGICEIYFPRPVKEDFYCPRYKCNNEVTHK